MFEVDVKKRDRGGEEEGEGTQLGFGVLMLQKIPPVIQSK